MVADANVLAAAVHGRWLLHDCQCCLVICSHLRGSGDRDSCHEFHQVAYENDSLANLGHCYVLGLRSAESDNILLLRVPVNWRSPNGDDVSCPGLAVNCIRSEIGIAPGTNDGLATTVKEKSSIGSSCQIPIDLFEGYPVSLGRVLLARRDGRYCICNIRSCLSNGMMEFAKTHLNGTPSSSEGDTSFSSFP